MNDLNESRSFFDYLFRLSLFLVCIGLTDISQDVQLSLRSAAISLAEVEIAVSARSEVQRRSPLTVESLSINAIKETPAVNFYEGLSHLKGVDLSSASLAFKVVNTRGFNSTSPVRSLQLINGVDNQSPGLNFSLYREEDLVDYDTRNTKASLALHYKLRPDVDLIAYEHYPVFQMFLWFSQQTKLILF